MALFDDQTLLTCTPYTQGLPCSSMKPIVEFALSTGCRAGEILGLEWSRVDLTRKVAWLDHGTTKSGDGRGIPLNADAVAALEATRGQHPRWCFTFAGKRIQQSSTAWDKAKQRAGIEDFRFHDLRHTWASWHVQSGTSLPELMELGGWKSYEMVLRYAQDTKHHMIVAHEVTNVGHDRDQLSPMAQQDPRCHR